MRDPGGFHGPVGVPLPLSRQRVPMFGLLSCILRALIIWESTEQLREYRHTCAHDAQPERRVLAALPTVVGAGR